MDNRSRKSLDGISEPILPSANKTSQDQPKPSIASYRSRQDNNIDKKSDTYGNISAIPDNLSGMKRIQPTYQNRSMLNKTLPMNSGANKNKPPTNKKPKNKWSKKRKILSSILVFIVLLLGAGTWFGSSIVGNLDRVLHGNIFSDVQALFSTTRLNGESQGRVNILLAGYQGKNSDEGALTDSIMVVSLNTRTHTAFTMSIPRDLWVNIPGIGHQRINDASTNSSFSQSGYFTGGMGQLQQIVEQDFHIPIDYYALIDYTAFKDAVNAIGGINIVIKSPDPRGLYDPNVNKAHGGPVRLPNGPVHLDGMQALALALARGDSPYAYGFPLSDINRTQHQRQMLIALEQKASSSGVLSNPITITHLVDAFGNNVKTNLSLADVIRLAHLTKEVNINNIKSYGLNYSGNGPSALLTTDYISGQDVLIPRAGINSYNQIQAYYQQIISTN